MDKAEAYPTPAKPEPYRNAIHRRGIEIGEISAERTKNQLSGKSGLLASLGGAQRAQRKNPARKTTKTGA
jgi:hypothetical protein